MHLSYYMKLKTLSVCWCQYVFAPILPWVLYAIDYNQGEWSVHELAIESDNEHAIAYFPDDWSSMKDDDFAMHLFMLYRQWPSGS